MKKKIKLKYKQNDILYYNPFSLIGGLFEREIQNIKVRVQGHHVNKFTNDVHYYIRRLDTSETGITAYENELSKRKKNK